MTYKETAIWIILTEPGCILGMELENPQAIHIASAGKDPYLYMYPRQKQNTIVEPYISTDSGFLYRENSNEMRNVSTDKATGNYVENKTASSKCKPLLGGKTFLFLLAMGPSNNIVVLGFEAWKEITLYYVVHTTL